MKFTVDRKELAEALNIVSKALTKKSNVPVEECFLLKTSDPSTLTIQAYNPILRASANIVTNVEEPGAICLNGKKLIEFVKNIDSNIITIKLSEDGNIAKISGNSTSFSMLVVPTDSFLILPDGKDVKSLYVRSDTFKRLVNLTAFAAASKDEVRPIFQGLQLAFNDNFITAAATNTHRIAVASEHFSGNTENFDILVPASVLNNIAKLLENHYDSIQISIVDQKLLTLTFDNLIFTISLIDGVFPPYDKVINGIKTSATIKLNPSDLLNAIKRISCVAKENEHNIVIFGIDGNILNVNSRALGEFTGADEVEITRIGEGTPPKIAFNLKYIADVLNAVVSDGESDILIEFQEKDIFPVKITIENDGTFQYILTPIRMN